jgi:hypothetical protein
MSDHPAKLWIGTFGWHYTHLEMGLADETRNASYGNG